MRIRMNIASPIATCLFAVALFACLPSADAAVVGFYDFDEGTGIDAADTSGSGFDAKLKGSNLPTWASGGGASGDVSDNSVKFIEGGYKSGYVDLEVPSRLQLTGSRTISYWLKVNFPFTDGSQSVFEKAYNHEGSIIIYDNGRLQMLVGDEPLSTVNNSGSNFDASFLTPTGTVTDATWIHVAQTRDIGTAGTGTREFFINGVGLGSSAWTLRNPNTVTDRAWILGTGYRGTIDGELDDFAFFDRSLTPSEVASMYQLDAQAGNALRAMGMNVPELDELWDIYNGGLGSSGTVDGKTWTYVDGISAGSYTLGQSWSVGVAPGSGQTGTLTFLLLDTSTNSGLLLSEVVPEPSSFLLLGLGALGLVRHTRRRRRA